MNARLYIIAVAVLWTYSVVTVDLLAGIWPIITVAIPWRRNV